MGQANVLYISAPLAMLIDSDALKSMLSSSFVHSYLVVTKVKHIEGVRQNKIETIENVYIRACNLTTVPPMPRPTWSL